MIEKLTIRNFKSWEICDLEFGKVTALFGANSSGKTSILQFLLMLKQTASSRDRRYMNLGGTSQDYVDLGGYQDAVHGHDLNRSVAFSLYWDPTKESTPFEYYDHAQLSVQYQYVNNEVIVSESTLKAHVEYDDVRFNMDNEPEYDEHYSGQISLSTRLTSDKQYKSNVEFPDKSKNQIDAPANLKNFYVSEFLNQQGDFKGKPTIIDGNLLTSLGTTLEAIQYLGPLRAYPQREYRWTGERPSTVGVRGEFAVQTMLADLVAGPVNGKEVQGQLLASTNAWLKHLGVVEEIALRAVSEKSRLYEVIVKSPNFKHEANLADVGFGVSQVLPIVVMAHLVPEGSLIILEQPELHLHPKVQAELADLFLELSIKRNIQFVIESHSEHLLMRLQRRIAERSDEFAKLTENDVKLYFCKRETQASVLERLQMDEYGRIANWPKDFFGDAFSERAAMTQAMLERQIANGKH